MGARSMRSRISVISSLRFELTVLAMFVERNASNVPKDASGYRTDGSDGIHCFRDRLCGSIAIISAEFQRIQEEDLISQ